MLENIIFTFGVPAIAILLFIVIITVLFKKSYKICESNQAMVITGLGGTSTVIGKSKFLFPFLQKASYMSLENIQVDFTSKDEIPTKDAINIVVDAVANMSIDQDPEILKIAASKFLGYTTEDIKKIVTPILEGNIREIISQTTLKELIQGDKKELSQKVAENVAPNLRDMGLKLTTFNIQNFKDKNEVIHNLGIENTVQISKDAAKAKASAEAEIAIAKAEANKAANEAQVAADKEIALKQQELTIQKAALKKEADTKQAEADAAKYIEAEKQRQEQEIATANANLARQEKEIELKEREVAIKERQLEATVKKQAEAEKYAAQQKADADLYNAQRESEADLYQRQKDAEAEKFEAEQAAEATRITAEAQAAKKVAEANAAKQAQIAEAEGIKARGEAEATREEAIGLAKAKAIKAQGEAEAEALMKKAEAMKQYGEAATLDLQLQAIKSYFEQLPAIAEGVAKGYASVDKINIYGGDASKLQEAITKDATQISGAFSEALGIDLGSILGGMFGGSIVNKKED